MISVTGKLNEQAKEFPNDSGVNFLVKIGVKEYNRKTKDDVWVNYVAFVFAKGNQIDFYRKVLIEGAIVEVGGEGIIPDVYGDKNIVTINIQNPTLGYVFAPQGGGVAPAAPAAPVAPAPQAPQAPQAPKTDQQILVEFQQIHADDQNSRNAYWSNLTVQQQTALQAALT